MAEGYRALGVQALSFFRAFSDIDRAAATAAIAPLPPTCCATGPPPSATAFSSPPRRPRRTRSSLSTDVPLPGPPVSLLITAPVSVILAAKPRGRLSGMMRVRPSNVTTAFDRPRPPPPPSSLSQRQRLAGSLGTCWARLTALMMALIPFMAFAAIIPVTLDSPTSDMGPFQNPPLDGMAMDAFGLDPDQHEATKDGPDGRERAYHPLVCKPLAPRPTPKTIHDLRPDDFSTIMGIGDSIMAGMGAGQVDTKLSDGIWHAMREWRGANFATGGDPESISVGNIIRRYRPDIRGLSYGNHSWEFCYGVFCPARSAWQPDDPATFGLNAASSGALDTTSNIDNQLNYLNKYLPTVDPDYQTSWKLAIYELGYNDLCSACMAPKSKAAAKESVLDNFRHQTRRAVERIRFMAPKTVVVLMGPFNLTQISDVASRSPTCKKRRAFLGLECPCLMKTANRLLGSFQTMDDLAVAMNDVLQDVANEYLDQYDDFGVIFDPGMSQLRLDTALPGILSGMDCFHPVKASHDKLGVRMWNNLMLPPEKRRAYSLTDPDKLDCLYDDSRIYFG